MKDDFDLALALSGTGGVTLARCNELSSPYGLALSTPEFEALDTARREALHNSGRVELSGGVLPQLICAFCSSDFISRDDYFAALLELQDIFYYFKTASLDTLSDDELIEAMRAVFDGAAGGETEYLAGLAPEELLRRASEDPRAGFEALEEQ